MKARMVALVLAMKRNSHKKAQKAQDKIEMTFVRFVPFCGYSSSCFR